jgi:rare lipoprotein A (peptidoglycan hydrolase)
MRLPYKTSSFLAALVCAALVAPAPALAGTDTGGVAAQPAVTQPAAASPAATQPAAASPAAATPSSGVPAHHHTLASWFGPGFYGNHTACGQTMSPKIVGVANRTLPCGTLVKFAVKGRTLVVPVVDRGPYTKGVEWDLTAGAAQQLGLAETEKVATRVVGQTANTPTLGEPTNELGASVAPVS